MLDHADREKIEKRLRFRRDASRYVRLAYLYCTFAIAILRSCYRQTLGPRRQLPKFADSLWRWLDARVYLDPHLIWQPTESYVERGDAFGLIPHELTPNPVRVTTEAGYSLTCDAVQSAIT